MPHPGWTPPSPSQLDLAGKIAGAFAAIGGVLGGMWMWVRDYKAKVAEERLKRETAQAAEFRKQLQEIYLQGRKDEQAALLAIRETVDGLDEWSRTHNLSDAEQFAELRVEQKHTLTELRAGQEHNAAEFAEIKSTLREMSTAMQSIRDTARDAAKDAERLFGRRKEDRS